MSANYSKWSDDWDFYLGRQWDPSIEKKRPYAVTANIIRPNIEDQVAFLTGGTTEIAAEPREYGDAEYARRVQQILAYDLERVGVDAIAMDYARTSLVTGTAFLKPFWNPGDLNGMGNVGLYLVDPAYLLTPPGAGSLDECAFVIHAQPYSLFEIRSMWPARGMEVRPDESLGRRFGLKATESAILGTTATTVTVRTDGPAQPEGEGERPYGMAWVFECWLRDQTTTETYDEMTGMPNVGLAYPNGRVITIADGLVLDDRPNPYQHNKFPFIRLTLNPIPGEMYGFSEVESTISQQKDYNDLRTDARELRKLMGNGVWIVPQGSITNYQLLRTKTGAIIPYIPIDGQRPERAAPNAFPPGYLEWMTQARGEVEYDMGIFAANRGQAPGAGIRSGRAIMALQEWGANRMSMKRKLFENALSAAAQQHFQLIRQFWTYPRAMRVTGQASERRRVFVGGMAVDPAVMALFALQNPEAAQGEVMTLKHDCDVRVAPRSTLTRDRDRDYMLARDQAGMGLISGERLLELGDLPGWEADADALRKKMQEQQAMQMMAMQQAQQEQAQQQKDFKKLSPAEQKEVEFGIEPKQPAKPGGK